MTIDERIADLSLAIADIYAADHADARPALMNDLRAFDSARESIDMMIHDSRDDFDDDELDLATNHRDALILAIALRLLDYIIAI